MDNSKKWLLSAVEELIEENQTLRKENQDLNDELDEYAKETAGLLKDIRRLNQRVDLEKSSEQIRVLYEELEEKNKEIEFLKESQDKLVCNLHDVTEKYEGALSYYQEDEENEKLYQEIEELHGKIKILQNEVDVAETLRSISDSAYRDLITKYITLVNEEDMIYDDQWY